MNSRLAVKDRLLIRNFTPADRNSLRQLCSATAFIGEPVESFMQDRGLFADWATVYYTDYEPQSIFLAEYDAKVIGYIMGCCKEEDYGRVFWRALTPGLFLKSLKSLFTKRSTSRFFLNLAKSFIRGEFRRPDFSKIYPAHLHINVDKDFRALGVGSMLMNKFLGYLKLSGIKAVRLATMSRKAAQFFKKSGFSLLYNRRITYFDYLPQENLYLYIYGKML